MEGLNGDNSLSTPVWAIFGDLMAGMVGVFVLLLVWFLGFQIELSQSLQEEVSKRQIEEQRRMQEETLRLAEQQRRMQEEALRRAEQEHRMREEALRRAEEQRRKALEAALADPLATGRVTLQDGRIGISGSVLFALNSDQLQPEGKKLLKKLVAPLMIFLGERDELLMVSGFTDNLPIQKGNKHFSDNWELSAQRALNVTRALIKEGMPPAMVFAAAFGAEQPSVPNKDAQSRAQNRRVEMAPVPRNSK